MQWRPNRVLEWTAVSFSTGRPANQMEMDRALYSLQVACSWPSPEGYPPKEFMKISPAGALMAKIFFSYSHRDEAVRDELEKHMAMLKAQGLIES